jgi:hypothetical protein
MDCDFVKLLLYFTLECERGQSLETPEISGFRRLEDACWLLVPKFTGSNTAEAVGFFMAKKFPARLPSEGK